MAVETGQFVGQLHVRGVEKQVFARAHGLHPSQLSAMLKCPSLPDDFMETLDRIAPLADIAEPEAVGSR